MKQFQMTLKHDYEMFRNAQTQQTTKNKPKRARFAARSPFFIALSQINHNCFHHQISNSSSSTAKLSYFLQSSHNTVLET